MLEFIKKDGDVLYNIIKINNFRNVKEIVMYCKENGIKGLSNLNKLIKVLRLGKELNLIVKENKIYVCKSQL